MSKITYKRILLKVSGEVLMGSQPFGIDLDTVARIADEVIACVKAGAQVALVIGGEHHRALEPREVLGMERIIYVKDVDGLHDRDPHKHEGAKLIRHTTLSALLDWRTGGYTSNLTNNLYDEGFTAYDYDQQVTVQRDRLRVQFPLDGIELRAVERLGRVGERK